MIGCYDWRLVFLSAVLAMATSYTALDLGDRVTNSRGWSRFSWLTGGAASMGIGIWSSHYVAMLAFHLPVPVLYDWPTELLALLAGIFLSAAALLVVSRRKMGSFRLLAGSIFMGAGLAILHYIGMAAMRMPTIFRYSPSLVALSAAVAIAGSFMFLWLLVFLLRGETDSSPWQKSSRKAAAALPMGAAMLGTHYAAMAAVRFAPAAIVPDLSHAVSISLPVALGIGAASGMVLAVTLLICLLARLRAQKTLLNELFEQAPLAVALATTGDDRVIRINRDFTRIFGYTRQAAAGRRISELIVPAESQDEYRKHADLVTRGERVDAEGVRCRQDGSRFPAAITLVPFSGPGQETAVYAIYRDIAKRQRAEEGQWAREGRWRAIFDNSAVGISVTDMDGKFIATNRAYREMVGYSEEELGAITYLDLTYEEDRPANAALVADIWAGRLPQFQLEKRYRRKDGQPIWARITASKSPGLGAARPLGICIVEDITERKRAEARLQKYEKVVESLQEMIVVVDREYRYLIANQAYLDYRGMQPEEVVGHLVPELMGQETFERVIKSKMDECLQGRVVKYEVALTYAKRGRRDIFASYFPIEGPAGVDQIAMVLEDITERKRAERELQRSFEELQALNAQLHSVREEERTRLARELHDQLGQALTAIRIDLAAMKSVPARDQQLQRIDAILGLVDETIHSVRRISTELRPGILDDLGLVAAVEWAAEEFQARTGIECQVSLPETNPAIDVERATALFRIFQETLTNIARHAGATQARISLSQENGYLSLEVRDNGCGIGRDQPSASGSLGILGMQERALLLGGEFQIADDPGSGTIVQVRIPVADRRQAAANQ
jgi:PAS domain S-box-containing protein